MKLSLSTFRILLFVGLFGALLPAAIAQESILLKTNMNIMLRAVQDGVYGSFISAGSDEFKELYDQATFMLVSEDSGPRLAAGYEAVYLTSLNINGYEVHLWKLSYADGGDDSLLSISIDNGFVAGFLIQ